MQQNTSINTTAFFFNALLDLKLSNERKVLLKQIAEKIASELDVHKKVNLNFICTHNSRRSQLAQVWSAYATNYFELENIESFSGGTAVTAFYRNTVKTLQHVGFDFKLLNFSHQNPKYQITYNNCKKPIEGFSKLYNDDSIKAPFIAITTCGNADENCPFIAEALHRFHLPFNDPKAFDNTPEQAEQYLVANKQIAGEIHFIFKKIKALL